MNNPGYHRRYLRVDLTARTSQSIPIAEEVLRDFLGGVGLGTWLLLRETSRDQDPLAADAPLCFIFSPLVGSPLTTSAKFAVMARSPLTQRINDSLSSSQFAIAGKKTGYDAFVVTGKADVPTCLVIEPDSVRFEDASSAWGHSSIEAAKVVKQQIGTDFRVASIGPAGEKLVRFATISHDGRHAGRGGMGAVMGSKNLKALAVRGDLVTPYAHPERVHALSRDLSRRSLGPATEKYRELGTVSNLMTFNRLGALPTRNFQQSTFARADQLDFDNPPDELPRTRASCAACTIGCEHIFPRSNSDGSGVRMEYENLFALGPLCDISDRDVVLEASALCDELGIDTISAGGTVAFAMECAEKGLIDAPWLRFGSGEALSRLLREIGARSGWGELFSLGTRAAAAKIGQGSEDFAPHVKGLEIPGYEPRALQTMALGFAVGTRGADHNRSGAYQVDFSEGVDRLAIDPDAVTRAIETENEAALFDSVILCKFLRGVFDDKRGEIAEMLHDVTGWDVTVDELEATAERIVTAKKWFNIRQGWTPEEDRLPNRFYQDALPEGVSQGAVLDRAQMQSMIEDYNRKRGWSPTGAVSAELLETLRIPTA